MLLTIKYINILCDIRSLTYPYFTYYYIMGLPARTVTGQDIFNDVYSYS